MNGLTLVFFHLLLATAFRLNSAEQCVGCKSPVKDSNSIAIRKLMSDTLRKTNAGYAITNVKNCKTQVVAGIKYDCEVDIKSPSGEPSTCRLEVVQRPWDKNNQVQVVSETCSSVSRSKREVCAGCPVSQDANGSEMTKKLSGILSQTNSGLSLVRGEKCTSQVVAGVQYDCTLQVESPKTNGVQTCQLVFVEKAWISPDPTIITDTCSKLVRNRREVCAGCPKEQDANSSGMKKKLTGILTQTNSGLSLVRGEKCTTQVVAGIKYDCTLQVESPKTNGVQTCKMSFVEQPWISPDPTILSDTCSSLVRNKREVCAGCPVEQDPQDSEIQKKITNTLHQANAGLTIVGVDKCTSQVVAGALYKCTVRVTSPQTNGVETCQVEMLEQPWISKEPQLVKSSCSQLDRSKRDYFGGLKDVDPSEKVLVQELAAFAVKTLDDIDSDNKKRVITEVVSAKKQLVNGIMYHLKLRVKSTSCDEDKDTDDNCLTEDAPQNMCDVQVYRSFADQSPLNAKVVKSMCEPVKVVSKLGGFEPVHTNGDEVQKAAKFAAKRISQMVNSIYVKRIVSIESAATQVVSGIKYAMTLVMGDTDCLKNKVNEDSVCKFLPNTKTNLVCQVEVYEKPWENEMKLVSSNCREEPNVSVERARRALLGGYEPVTSNDDSVKEAADFAERRINQMVNSVYVKKIVSVEEASKQIVAGTNYNLVLHLQDTDCKKNKMTENSICQVLDNAKMTLVCNVVVYKDLENLMHLSSVHCDDIPQTTKHLVKNKRALDGQYQPVETNDINIQKAASLAETKINQMINSAYVKKVSSIEQAKYQIVAGTNYDLTLILQDTDCFKNHYSENSICQFNPDVKSVLSCNVVVYKNLNDEMSVSQVHCTDVPKTPHSSPRNKRQATASTSILVGAGIPVDVNSAEIISLYPHISKKITRGTNAGTLMMVTHISNATKQVVAGVKYNLNVILTSTECPANVDPIPESCNLQNPCVQLLCEVVVWTKPWLKFIEVVKYLCKNHPKKDGKDEEDRTLIDEEIENLAKMLETTVEDKDFHLFSSFLTSYEKVYPTKEEYKKRFSIFRANMKKVKYLQDTEQGTGQYGATQFSDLTKSEFKKYFLGLKVPKGDRPKKQQAVIPNVTLPLEYDWRDYGAVTNVKNQGMCGSCWAFSITGNVEGQYAIQNKKLLSLSEQELVDCDKYDNGCQGGFFDSAFHALEDLGGLETESDYPYEGYDDQCRFNSSKVKVTISSSVNISSDETSMAKWLYKNGPITVAVNANAMQFYMGGVSHPLKFLCSPDELDHGVLIVGFGVHKTRFLKRNLPYWIVKNSWGPGWGKQGYYWLYRGDGSCGINKMPTSAIL